MGTVVQRDGKHGSDQFSPPVFDNHHPSDEACGNGGLVLSMCVYRVIY